jgi:hypothetical protein
MAKKKIIFMRPAPINPGDKRKGREERKVA